MPGVMQFLQSIFFVLISVGFVWQLPAAEHGHQQHVHWQNEEASFSAIDLCLAADIPVQINRGYAGRLFSPFQAGDQRRINKSGHSISKLIDYPQDQQQPAEATAGLHRNINLDGGHVARGVATLTPQDNAGNIGWLPEHDLQATYRQQRYEHLMIARFYSNDPVGFTAANPMMFNRYAYANNNPYKFTDPDGRAALLRNLMLHAIKIEKRQSKKPDSKKSEDIKNQKQPENKPISEKNREHIFRDAEGHLLDTPENVELVEDVANSESDYLGPDEHGNDWSSRTQEDGKQVWVQMRGGKITNAGINDKPRTYNPKTGLSSPYIPKKKGK